MYELVLPNYQNKYYNEVDKRICFFTCNNYEEMRKIDNSKETEKIIQILEMLSMDEKFTFMYNAERGRELELEGAREGGYEDGLEDGIEKGIEQKTKEMIKAFSDLLTPEQIAEKTNLSIEEVKNIINTKEN